MWPLECKQDLTKIWPSDLLFDPIQPIFKLNLDMIETNILTKSQEDQVINVAPRV